MEITNAFLGNCHGSSLLEMKRCSKGTELDNRNTGDFFGIEDLLDFSNEDIGGPIEAVCCTAGLSSLIPTETVSSNCSGERKSLQIPNCLGSNETGDLCVPCDDFAELEWLSNFVEESFSSGDASATVLSSSLYATKGEQKHLRAGNQQFQSESPVSVLESSACSLKHGSSCLELAVPGRARSKRSRTGSCIWNTSILTAAAASSDALQSSSTCTLTTLSQLPDMDHTFAHGHGWRTAMPPKTIKPILAKAKNGQDAAQTRRCLHCGSQRTPQWRAGPLGPKTLCNACGVRYKSGRLLPEYRPAASPTFMESVHSNSHKKVLEMRRQREEDDAFMLAAEANEATQ